LLKLFVIIDNRFIIDDETIIDDCFSRQLKQVATEEEVDPGMPNYNPIH